MRLRFYAHLNRLLAPERRGGEFCWQAPDKATARHVIEALGVPHTEVDALRINGEAAGFERRLGEGDRLAVYPAFQALELDPHERCGATHPSPPRFIADAHLGALARLLRMAGFDTVYENALRDEAIARLAASEARIVLSRDRDLLKRRDVERGCLVQADAPAQQWREVAERFDLAQGRPFSRCIECNAPLRPVDKALVASRLPPRVRERHDRYTECPGCGRLYWEGSHWQRMRARLDELLTPRAPARATQPACPPPSPTREGGQIA